MSSESSPPAESAAEGGKAKAKAANADGEEKKESSSTSTAPPPPPPPRLTLDSIFESRDFKAESYSQPRWWREGSQYTTLDRVGGRGDGDGNGRGGGDNGDGGGGGRQKRKGAKKAVGGAPDGGADSGSREGSGADTAAVATDVVSEKDPGDKASSSGPSGSGSAGPPPPSGARDVVWHDASTGASSVYVSHSLLIPPGSSDPLPVDDYSFSPDRSRLLVFTNSRKVWRKKTRGDYWVLDVTARELRQLGGREAKSSSLMFATFSRDGNKVAYVRERNLFVQDVHTFAISQLTFDGSDDVINGTFDWVYEEEFSLRRGFRWSPDSTRLAFWRIDQSGVRVVNLINNTDYLYPKVIPIPYPKTGERNAECRVGVVTVPPSLTSSSSASAAASPSSAKPPPEPKPEPVWIDLPGDLRDHYVADLDWIKGSGELYLQRLNRLQNEVKLYVCDPETGKADVVFEDRDDAWLDLQRIRWLTKSEGRKFLWLSERGGWRQLYVVERCDGKGDGGDDGGGGEAKMTALTAPTHDVCAVSGVDEEDEDGDGKGGWVYFIASPDDPLRRYLYRAPLDGDGRSFRAERVTPESMRGTNSYVLSSDAKFAIHVRSTFESPETTRIVRLPDHEVRLTLADNERMRERLGRIPELSRAEFFRVPIEVAKEGGGKGDGEDGDNDGDSDGRETVELDAYALLPPNFDPSKKYPVLFYVYGEPAMQVVRDAWTGRNGLWHRLLAQRGYVIVSVDNRGTPGPRGRRWRKCVYRQIGILAPKDQAAAVQSLLKSRPYLDPDRVAVWGWSGGGSMSLNAVFRYPELYSAAMSVAPVPNQRGYDTIYQERYMGLPSDNVDGYRDGSPITRAHRLKGNLLLVHGTGDDNCHYAGTEALIDELIRHGKTFSMMAYPNRSHSISEGSHTTRHLFGLLTDFLGRNVPAGAAAAEEGGDGGGGGSGSGSGGGDEEVAEV